MPAIFQPLGAVFVVLFFLITNTASATVKCEAFINHELKLAGTGSTFSKTAKCYSRIADAKAQVATIYQKVAPKMGCAKEPNGYVLPGWGNYSAFGVKSNHSGEQVQVETLFSYGADMSMDSNPYDLSTEPRLIFRLNAECKIESVRLPADDSKSADITWTPDTCLKLKRVPDPSKLARSEQVVQEGCALLVDKYSAFLPSTVQPNAQTNPKADGSKRKSTAP